MNRRTLLKSGVLTGVNLSLSRVAPAASGLSGQSESIARILQDSFIWCADAVTLPTTSGPDPSVAPPGVSSVSPVTRPDLWADQHAAFWHAFTLPSAALSPQLHLFAYTRYRLYINGRYIVRGPCRYQNQHPEYDNIDLTPHLAAGRNTLAVLAHRDSPSGRIMAHAPGFTAALVWHDAAGAQRHFATSPDWHAASERSFLARSSCWSSITESIDARLMPDWTSKSFDGTQWPAAVSVSADPTFYPLSPRSTPLQRETPQAFSRSVPVTPPESSSSSLELTLPRIVQAFHVLEFEAAAGLQLEVEYRLPEGQSSGSCSYTARAGRQTWISGDTFAFDHIRIHCVTPGDFHLLRSEAVEVLYPFTLAGSFQCSDPRLDRLWNICMRSLQLLSEDSYVDCADRERVEWTDDSPPAFDLTRVAMQGPPLPGSDTPVWADPRLLKSLLRRVSLTQMPDGQMKSHTCSNRWDVHAIMEDRSCDWVLLLQQYYEATSDKAFVREMWPATLRLLHWFLDHRTPRGLVQAREWEVWDNPLRYQVCEGAGLNAFVYQALRAAATLGRSIGRQPEAAGLAAAAEQLQQSFNLHLWNADAGTYSGALFGPTSSTSSAMGVRFDPTLLVNGVYPPTFQAALFALESGIVSPERLPLVQKYMLANFEPTRHIMSNYYLFRQLYSLNRPDLDIAVLDRIRKLWASQIASPWQTTWEAFDDGSKIHTYGMVPGYFLSAYVLGVRREAPVSARALVIEPHLGDLAYAKGSVMTEFGPVPISWTRHAYESLSLSCTVPENVSAQLRLHGDVHSTLPSGPHIIELKAV